MPILQHADCEVATSFGRSSATQKDAWRKAMARFEASLGRIKPIADTLAAAEHAEFEARALVEAMTPTESLTVKTVVEFYFNNGLDTPICRRSAPSINLHDEAAIARFVKDDAEAGAYFLAELAAWREQRRELEVALGAAKAEAERQYSASGAAIDRSDAQLLKVLRTPAPGMLELRWKIETLHKADCNARCEKLGWAYVLRELAVLTDGVSDTSTAMN